MSAATTVPIVAGDRIRGMAELAVKEGHDLAGGLKLTPRGGQAASNNKINQTGQNASFETALKSEKMRLQKLT